MTFNINAAPPGATGQLGVLPRGQIDVHLAIPFNKFFQHHRPRRHINSKCQGLGGENHFE